MELTAVRDIVIDMAKEAGAIALDYYQRPLVYNTKASNYDIVTEGDKATELAIVAQIKKHFPGHYIHGEEGGGQGDPNAEYHWYVDPIDGTTNYAHCFPYWCTSIAMTTQDRQPLVGVLYAPVMNDLFVAVKGQGAMLNGQPIHVAERAELAECIVVSGFPYDRKTNPDNNQAEWSAMAPLVRGLRRLGSAALDMANIAAGRLDGYWERGLHPWDTLAGVLLIQEAGGKVSTYSGEPNPQNTEEGRYLVSNGHVHQKMVDVLMSARKS
ncbi:MAG: inositol monophosphatase [Anaerolineaceae bacterium]|nr:inositol monophosphatase [Anaerolineaceae bacterium]